MHKGNISIIILGIALLVCTACNGQKSPDQQKGLSISVRGSKQMANRSFVRQVHKGTVKVDITKDAITVYPTTASDVVIKMVLYSRWDTTDTDEDDVPDAVDACPDTPGSPSDDPLLNGCPSQTDGRWDTTGAETIAVMELPSQPLPK